MKTLKERIARMSEIGKLAAAYYHELTVAGVPEKQASDMSGSLSVSLLFEDRIPKAPPTEPWEKP